MKLRERYIVITFVIIIVLWGCYMFLQLYKPEVTATTKFPEKYLLEQSSIYIDEEILETIFDYDVRNPTYSEVQEFVQQDKTNQKERIPEQYVCLDFAQDFIRNAGKQGIRVGFVRLVFLEGAPHGIVVFDTTDRGLIFIEPQTDEEVIVLLNQVYRKKVKRSLWQILIGIKEEVPIRLVQRTTEEKHEYVVKSISVLWNDCDLAPSEVVRTIELFEYKQISIDELVNGFNMSSSSAGEPMVNHSLFGERVIFSVLLNETDFYSRYLRLSAQDKNGSPITILISGQDWKKIENQEIMIWGRIKVISFITDNETVKKLSLNIHSNQIR